MGRWEHASPKRLICLDGLQRSLRKAIIPLQYKHWWQFRKNWVVGVYCSCHSIIALWKHLLKMCRRSAQLVSKLWYFLQGDSLVSSHFPSKRSTVVSPLDSHNLWKVQSSDFLSNTAPPNNSNCLQFLFTAWLDESMNVARKIMVHRNIPHMAYLLCMIKHVKLLLRLFESSLTTLLLENA